MRRCSSSIGDPRDVDRSPDHSDAPVRESSSPADAKTVTDENHHEVRAAFDVLMKVDLDACDFRELDVVRGAAQRVRGFIASIDVRVSRRGDELVEQYSQPRPTAPDHPADDAGGTADNGASGEAGDDTGESASGRPTGDGNCDGDSGGAEGWSSGLAPGDRAAFGATSDRRSDAEVARDRGRYQACAAMPAFEAALTAGRIDVTQVDAIVAALGRIDVDEVRAAFIARADELVGYAEVERPDRFRRRCNDMVLRMLRAHGVEVSARQRRAANARSWWDRVSGMFHLHLEVEPELGAKIEAAIDQRIASRREQGADETFQRLRVEAIADLILSSSALDPRLPELVVLVDLQTLTTGLPTEGGMCESLGGGELSPETVRRLACDAGITPVVMGGDSLPLDVGRTKRVATAAQRKALRAMYRTCAHPKCNRRFNWCRMHHITFWEFGGLTCIENLLPLCDEHHHEVHEGGWTLTMTPDRVCTWITPSGVIWFQGDPRDGVHFGGTTGTATTSVTDPAPTTGSSENGTSRIDDIVCESNLAVGEPPVDPIDPSGQRSGQQSDDDAEAAAATGGGASSLTSRRRSAAAARATQTRLTTVVAPPSAP